MINRKIPASSSTRDYSFNTTRVRPSRIGHRHVTLATMGSRANTNGDEICELESIKMMNVEWVAVQTIPANR